MSPNLSRQLLSYAGKRREAPRSDGAFDDVTQLERNKAELIAARDEAQVANKAKSDFLENMGHEIRNPMNTIVGFSDTPRRGLEEGRDQRIDYLNTIHSNANPLVGVINDIPELSKVRSKNRLLPSTVSDHVYDSAGPDE